MIRFGIAGMTSDHVWGMGDGLAALPEVQLVAGAEPYPELREKATRQWNLSRTYEDVHTMLDKEELDALLVCGDNASKAEIAESAARRKVHVYQDKPMAATLAQADRILRAAEDSGITLMVAYHSAFNPVYDQVKELLRQGAIGRLYLARGVTGHGGPVEYGCSQYFCEWLFDRHKNGGGTFIDEACYLLDGFVDYFGAISEVSAFTAPIGSVTGDKPRHREYLPDDVEDNAVAILRFANGALGVIDSKWGQVGPAPVRTSFHGTQGTLTNGPNGTELHSTAAPRVPDDWQTVETPAGRGGGRMPEGLQAWRAPTAGPNTGRGGREQRYFVDCLLEGRPIEGASSPRVARDVQAVIDAVYRSAETGRAVQLPARSPS
ncbi:MAG TPA: Gfo/Idh/MocA family oxidoreductase [Chloroflexota bacterium]|nr:Gfo/Idh/MocA family oxidoreductase [Chloroflexota bacterium]